MHLHLLSQIHISMGCGEWQDLTEMEFDRNCNWMIDQWESNMTHTMFKTRVWNPYEHKAYWV